MGDDGRVFCSYDIYKGKAAVNVKPVAPTYAPTGENAFAVKRPGGLLFEAAPASGTRTYDWSRKARSVSSLAAPCRRVSRRAVPRDSVC